jgi:hypothetical protein
MSETSTETPADEAPQGAESEIIAQLRKDAADGKAARKELESLKRERAFDQAGVPTDGAGKWFRKGYDGDIEVDAIKQAAIEDGLVAAPSGQEPAEVEEAFVQSDRIAEAAAGTQTAPTVEALMEGAKNMDEIEAIANNAGISVPIR